MSDVQRAIRDLPVVARLAVVGALVLGAAGAAVGLVLGLLANPSTAWAATVEVGLPAAVLGAVLGALAGTAVRLRQRDARRS